MRYISAFILLAVVFIYSACVNNNNSTDKAKNTVANNSALKANEAKVKFGGTYAYGNDPENEPVGIIKIYPLTANTAIFHIFVMIGGPSYNSGELFGDITFKGNTAIYEAKSEDGFINCKLKFEFNGETLNVTSGEKQYECGFGNAVYADGTYKLTDKSIPEYFIDRTGDTTYFKDLRAAEYE